MSPEPHQPVRGRGGPADQLAVGLNVAAVTGLAYIAGFHAVYAALTGFRRPFLCAVPAALAVSAIGYYFAYQSIYAAEGGYALSRRQLTAVVAAGFGGLFTNGGPGRTGWFSAPAARADARRWSASLPLAGLEQAMLALYGCATSIAWLCLGLPGVPLDFMLPWAVIAVPGSPPGRQDVVTELR